MNKWHITRDGEPKPCFADTSKSNYRGCPYGSLDEHFTTKEAARQAYEERMNRLEEEPDQALQDLGDELRGWPEADYLHEIYSHIWRTDRPWSTSEKQNLIQLVELKRALETRPWNSDAENLVREIAKNFILPRGNLAHTRHPSMERLKDAMLVHRLSRLSEPLPASYRNPGLPGLEKSQNELLTIGILFPNEVRKLSQVSRENTLGRLQRGDGVSSELLELAEVELLPKNQQLFSILHPSSPLHDQRLYLTLAFPSLELDKSLAKEGVDRTKVEVKPFLYKAKEIGNTYTTTEPNGTKRTFFVYQYRNSDEIYVNGKTNWDGKEPPYTFNENPRSGFFSTKWKDYASTATYLAAVLKGAQDGSLPPDIYLLN